MPGQVRPVTDERDGLPSYLAQQRYFVRLAAYGLTDDQARQTPSASTLSIGGLIKHLTVVERNWMDVVLQRQREPDQDWEANFILLPDETLAGALDRYDEAARETEEIIAGVPDLDQPVPVPPAPWNPRDVEAWSVRWVLLHLIEETARHAGHADIIRESLDGANAMSLMAAAEGWPPTPWVQPWSPRES